MKSNGAVLKLKELLKNKTILLANWGCGDKDTFQCRDWIPIFKRVFKKVIVMSFRNHYYFYGKKILNENFLKIIEKQKPDYLIFGHRYNEIEIDTILKIKKLSPNTKTIIEYGDDDSRFDDWGRYYCLFFDYIWTSKKELSIYKNDKRDDAYFMIGISTDYYKPLSLKKIYDVSFIGRPIADRYDYIRFLLDKGINLALFGVGWTDYPDLKDIQKGFLHDEDFVKVINQSKINLNFSKTLYDEGKKGQIKGKIMEIPACGSFLLNEYTEMNPKFINKRKEINFKTKEELLEKINYYLKNEKEREKLAELVYKDVLNEFTWEKKFAEFFQDAEKNSIKKFKLPKFNKKTFIITENEIQFGYNKLKNILNGIDFVFFRKNKSRFSKYKEYFQSYSLYISKKQISCCDYSIYSNKIGDYLLFKSKNAFNTLNKKDFLKILNINQIAVRKDYFLENLESFKKLFNKELTDIINSNNIVFVSIPLIRIKRAVNIEYSIKKEVFHLLFFDRLMPFIYQKNFFHNYLLRFLLFSLNGNFYMIRHIYLRLFNKYNFELIKSFQYPKID